jgi:hypothetical protein
MKKTILTIVICLISSATFAQAKIEAGQNEREKLAGLELKKFANHHYLGTALGVGGGVMFVAGYSMRIRGESIYSNAYYNGQLSGSQMSDADNKIITGTYLMIGGQLLTLAGLVYKIEAPLHIKKAGLILSGNGVSINVKLN